MPLSLCHFYLSYFSSFLPLCFSFYQNTNDSLPVKKDISTQYISTQCISTQYILHVCLVTLLLVSVLLRIFELCSELYCVTELIKPFSPATTSSPTTIVIVLLDFTHAVEAAYAEVVTWRRNVFNIHSGKNGKAFVFEIARLF